MQQLNIFRDALHGKPTSALQECECRVLNYRAQHLPPTRAITLEISMRSA